MNSPYDPLLTFEEAGELLGTGPDLPRRLVETGHLEHVQEGDAVRVLQSALIAYVIAQDARSATDSATGTEREAA